MLAVVLKVAPRIELHFTIGWDTVRRPVLYVEGLKEDLILTCMADVPKWSHLFPDPIREELIQTVNAALIEIRDPVRLRPLAIGECTCCTRNGRCCELDNAPPTPAA